MSDADELAMAAMQGILAGDPYMIWRDGQLQINKVAELSYLMADAMLKERAKIPKKPLPMPTPMPGKGMPKGMP